MFKGNERKRRYAGPDMKPLAERSCIFIERGLIFMFGLVPFGSRHDLAKKEDGFDRLFDIFNEPFFSSEFSPFKGWGAASFKVDVKDTGSGYELTADLPGVRKEDISLRYENNYLTIEAKKDEATNEKDDQNGYIRRERSVGSVTRSFYIDNIDEAKVSAEFKDGVLKVCMSKLAEAEKPKEITIH